MNKELDEDNLGTHMLSRSGLSTVPQYLCFQKGSLRRRMVRKQNPDSEKLKYYEFEEEQVDLSAFKKEFDDIQEK